MELLILIVAFVLWILQKVLSSSNKEAAKRRKKRPPRTRSLEGSVGGADGFFPLSGSFSGSTPTEIPYVPPLPPQPDLSRRISSVSRKKSRSERTGEGCSGGDLRGGKTGGNPEGGTASDSGCEKKEESRPAGGGACLQRTVWSGASYCKKCSGRRLPAAICRGRIAAHRE